MSFVIECVYSVIRFVQVTKREKKTAKLIQFVYPLNLVVVMHKVFVIIQYVLRQYDPHSP